MGSEGGLKILEFFLQLMVMGGGGVALFLSTDIHTQDRLDEWRSAEKQQRD